MVLGKGVWTGAGNYVSTANPGGETFVYMHLDTPSELNEGDVLNPGDLIGYVGDQRFRPDHLHLGVNSPKGEADAKARIQAVARAPRVS